MIAPLRAERLLPSVRGQVSATTHKTLFFLRARMGLPTDEPAAVAAAGPTAAHCCWKRAAASSSKVQTQTGLRSSPIHGAASKRRQESRSTAYHDAPQEERSQGEATHGKRGRERRRVLTCSMRAGGGLKMRRDQPKMEFMRSPVRAG